MSESGRRASFTALGEYSPNVKGGCVEVRWGCIDRECRQVAQARSGATNFAISSQRARSRVAQCTLTCAVGPRW